MVMPRLGAVRLTAVVAASMQNGIGAQGGLPWRLPKDMAYFRSATSHVVDTPVDDATMQAAGYPRLNGPTKNAVVMGRNTWESIPPRFRPLSDRINVVVSTTLSQADLGVEADPDTVVVRSFDDAVAFLAERRLARYIAQKEEGAALGHAFIIGGAAIYRYVLTHTSPAWRLENLLVTRLYHPSSVHDRCDVFLEDFRSHAQLAYEKSVETACKDALPTDVRICPDDVDPNAVWRQASPEEHRAFLADAPHTAQVGDVFRDKDIAVQFQLWRRRLP